jgi:hypothetical protein
MIYLVTAILLIFISNAAALLIIAGVDIMRYVDIVAICRMLEESVDQCTAAAVHAGWVGCAAAVILFVLLLLTNRRFPSPVSAVQLGSSAFVAFAPLVIIIAAFNLWTELNSPLTIYRSEIFSLHSASRAAALSLSNFIWPLCLQLANSAISLKWRILFLSLLAVIVAEIPLRGVVLAVAIFGIAAPAIERAIVLIRLRGLRFREVAIYGSIILVGSAAMIAQLAIETQRRTTDLKIAGGITSQVTEKLGQRIAMPLYQAHLALAHDIDQHIPSISDEVLAKLRLRKGVGINGYLFALSHPTSYGETTSLYFGEAALRTVAPALIWCIVGPFMLVLVWVALRRRGYATGTLIGIAVWRGSLGGIIGIIPALTFQFVLFMVLTFLFKAEKFNGR